MSPSLVSPSPCPTALGMTGAELQRSVADGATLPAGCYTDLGIFEFEQRALLPSSWIYAGHRGQLRRPGDFVTATVARVPLIVTVDPRGELRGFVNVCPHRGAEMMRQPCGHRQTIQCHYHGWTWNLDGALRAAPSSAEEPDFDPSRFALRPIHVATFGPFVFVNVNRDAPPFEGSFGALARLIHERGTDLDQLTRRDRKVYDMKANWKVVVENFLECYHCAIAHPGFTGLIDLAEYRTTCDGLFSYQVGALKDDTAAANQALFGGREDARQGHYNYMWPSFMVNVYPGQGNASTNIIVPMSADRTIAIYDFYFADDVADADAERIIAFVDQVQREDVHICESVQRGLASGHYHQGRLIRTREAGVHHFQQLMAAVLANGARAPG